MRNYLSKRNESDGFGFNFFDDAFESFFSPMLFAPSTREMRTDIKETDTSFELAVDMPGYDKEQISLSLRNGYLTVEAQREDKQEEKYLKRERSYTCKRSYYVGEGVTEEDVKAKYDKGILSLTVNKPQQKKIENKTIPID